MSKPSTGSKISQLPSKSAWAKGPPQSNRSESPAPTHSRRPSAAIAGVPIKDGVSIPRNNVGSVKQASSVTFGSIDNASAPISSSPAATPAVKTVDSVKSFGSVPINGSESVLPPTKPSSPAPVKQSGTPPAKLQRADIAKLFQNPSTAAPSSSSTPSDTSSPSVKPATLPSQPSPSQQPAFTSFVPQNGVRQPSQQNAPPRSPQYPRQMPNGNGARPQNGPPSGLSSPRLAPMTGQPAAMPPPPSQMPQMQPAMWPGSYYYLDPQYMPYAQSWYGMPQPMPQQHQQPPPPTHMPHMPVSPRIPPPPLQGPGTPTPAHAVPATHSPHPSTLSLSSTNSISGLSSPPPTPSTPARLNQNAAAFVPGRTSSKITIKSADGNEVQINDLKNKTATSAVTSATSNAGSASPKRASIVRLEKPEDKAKRIAEEKEAARIKAEAEDKARKAKEDEERKAKEELERKEREEQEKKKKEQEERIRKEQEEKERERKIEEELKEKLRKEEEERKRKEEEERKQKEEEEQRLKKEEEERRREEEQKIRKEEEEKQRLEKERIQKEEDRLKKEEEEERVRKEEEEKEAKADDEQLEEGQIIEEPEAMSQETDKKESKDKAPLRINTAPPTPASAELRRRPGPLDLSGAKGPIAAPLPSALATARIIEDIKSVTYPEGIKSPRVELNANAKDGKFRYDREFLLQFMAICKDKPDMLPPLDAIGLEPTDQPGRRQRTPSTTVPPRVPFNGSNFGKMGNFNTMGGPKVNEERFPGGTRAVSMSGPAPPFGRPAQMTRTTSQGGRVRSQRGKARDNKQAGAAGSQGQGSGFHAPAPANTPPLDYVPLQATANRWDRKSVANVDTESPELVDRKVKGLLNKLTMEKFDSISDQIVGWANKSEKEKDGRTLIQVIRLVFEKATDEATWSEMYARLCRKMMETISGKVQDDGIKNNEGKPIAGGQLFRKYLLNRCQEDFERGWAAKEATAAAAATKGEEDAKAAAAEGGEEAALYSDEYYAAQKAKRQGLGLIKFIGELFKLQMLTERIMHECIKKLLGNVENPEEEEIESLCKLLTTVGSILDTSKARAHMDVYFSRMKELTKSQNVSSRMQFMLQDVIELRERKWVNRNAVAAPTTIAAVHEQAARETAQTNTYQRTISMSRGGSKRGADRAEYQPDGWTTAGSSSAPRPPSKAGDLSKFGKISNASAPTTFGPASVFSNKNKDGKKEALSRSSSNSNMFSMLSSNPEASTETATAKSSRPPSRKTSVDFTQSGGVPPEVPPQRRRLILQPRSRPVEDQGATLQAEESDSSEEEEEEEFIMSDAEAKKKIEEDTKEFYAVRNLEEAEVYFSKLPPVHHPKLVDKLVSLALESKEADAVLVAKFFTEATAKNLCSAESFEAGFGGIMEFLDDIAIDAPLAPKLMAIMIQGPSFSDAQLSQLAAKSEENGAHLLPS